MENKAIKTLFKNEVFANVLATGMIIYLLYGIIKLYTPMFSPGFKENVLAVGWAGLILPIWYLIVTIFLIVVVVPQAKKINE